MKPQDLRNLVNSKEFKEHYKNRKPIMIMVEKIYKELGETESVLIGGILNYTQPKDLSVYDKEIDLLGYWEKRKDPLENQSDKCIKFVYQLIIPTLQTN